MDSFTPVFIDSYDPLKAGSIDSTDEFPHDRAIIRAMNASYKPNKHLPGDPECTIFVGRLSPNTTEQTIEKAFSEFGDVINVKIVRDLVTGFSKCYGFIEMADCYQARVAVRSGQKIIVDDHEVLVDSEKERMLKGWVPRRLGGGLGGKKESGQLRFGGRDRPFSRPILYTHTSGHREESRSDKHSLKHRLLDSEHRSRRNKTSEKYDSRSRNRLKTHSSKRD